MKKFFLILIFISTYSSGYSQIYYQHWISRYNGTANDYDRSNAIAVDASGNVYVTGTSASTGTDLDCVTIKYNTYGVLQQYARYNGPVNGIDGGVAIDPYGDVYVTGTLSSQNGTDILIIKYDSNLDKQWVRTYHSLDFNGGRSIAIDAGLGSGEVSVLVTGYRYPSGFPSLRDYLTIKYNSAGDFQWEKIYNGTGYDDDLVEKIVVDYNGNSYITGYSKCNSGNYDIVTIKYNSNSIEEWVRRYNGSANTDDFGFSIALDSYANVYVIGGSNENHSSITTIKYNTSGEQQWIKYYYSPNYGDARGFDVAVLENPNLKDIYIFVTGVSSDVSTGWDYTTIKYNSSGYQQWVSRYATSNSEDAHHIVVDIYGNSYVSGRIFQNGYPDYLTISYNTNGNLKWSRTYNGSGNRDDVVMDIALDVNRNVFITGYCTSPTLIDTSNNVFL